MGGINASQTSFSSFRPVSDAGKQLKQLADQLLAQKVDSKIQKALQDAIVELDKSLSTDASMSALFRAAEKVIHMVDVIGAIDSEFVLDQLEELNRNKRSKKAELSTYLLDKSRQIDVTGVAAAASATLSVSAVSALSSSSSSQSSTDSSDDETLSGTPYGPLTMIDPHSADIQHNELGAIAALGQQMMENRALTSSSTGGLGMGLMDGKITLGGHMLSFISDLTPEELMEELMGILEGGIDDISDLTKLLKILGELGANVPQNILDKIKEVIGEFLAEAMSTTGSMTEFLVLLQQIQSMAGDLGGDLLSELGGGGQLASIFGESNLTEGDKTMAEGLGIVIEETSTTNDSFDSEADPMDEEMKLMQNMDEFASDLTGISFENSVAQAVAGAQHAASTKSLFSTHLDELKDTPQRVEALSKTDTSSTLLGDKAVTPLEEIVKATLDFLYSHRDEFGDQVREFVESYMENDLLDRLDVLAT